VTGRWLIAEPASRGGSPFCNLYLTGIVDVLGDLAEIAHIEPLAAGGAFHVVFGCSASVGAALSMSLGAALGRGCHIF
jgi:hypothetical protein